MADDFPDDPVYYRIYLSARNTLGVASLQSFDERDYQQDRFLPDEKGEAMRWEHYDEARQYLNDHFKREFIDKDDLLTLPVDFDRMRKTPVDV